MHPEKISFWQGVTRYLLIATAWIMPLFFVRGFVFPGTFPKTTFFYIAVSIILIIWLITSLCSGQIRLKQSWLLWALGGYIAVLLLSALSSGHFEQSFFSSHERMTGVLTFIYAFIWFVLATSVFQPKDWLKVFRGITITGALVAIVSFFGNAGFNLQSLGFLEHGGGILTNSTFAGIYYMFAFLIGIFLLVKDSSPRWRWVYIASLIMIGLNPDIFNFAIWRGTYSLGEVASNPILLAGQARASALSIGIGVLAMAVAYGIHRLKISITRRQISLAAMCLVLIGLTLAFVGSALAGKGLGHTFLQKQGDFARPIVWQKGLDAFQQKPLLGYGPNNFNYAFQDNYSPEVAFLEGANWFDKLHNASIGALAETGAVGALALITVFGIAAWYAFSKYRQTNDITFIFLITILIAHFIQIQTSFNTSLSLFVVFILLAYLGASAATGYVTYGLRPIAKAGLGIGAIAAAWAIIAFSILPAVDNRLIITAMSSGSFEERLEMYEALRTFKGDGSQLILSVTEAYINALFASLQQFNNPEGQQKIKTEMEAIIGLYEDELSDNQDDFRYLVNYANILHIANLFGVDRMDRAAEILAMAESLSTSHPQLYWLSALQARYLGNNELALAEIEKAVVMNEQITYPQSWLGQTPTISLSIREFLRQNKDNPGKIYYQVTEL